MKSFNRIENHIHINIGKIKVLALQLNRKETLIFITEKNKTRLFCDCCLLKPFTITTILQLISKEN